MKKTNIRRRIRNCPKQRKTITITSRRTTKKEKKRRARKERGKQKKTDEYSPTPQGLTETEQNSHDNFQEINEEGAEEGEEGEE